jgi:TctA family transporter
VLLLVFVGGYIASGDWRILFVLLGLGVLAYGLKRCGWPRAPFVIGIVLGPLMDISLHQSLAIWGPAFVFRPIAFGLLLAIIATILVSARRTRAQRGERAVD